MLTTNNELQPKQFILRKQKSYKHSVRNSQSLKASLGLNENLIEEQFQDYMLRDKHRTSKFRTTIRTDEHDKMRILELEQVIADKNQKIEELELDIHQLNQANQDLQQVTIPTAIPPKEVIQLEEVIEKQQRELKHEGQQREQSYKKEIESLEIKFNQTLNNFRKTQSEMEEQTKLTKQQVKNHYEDQLRELQKQQQLHLEQLDAQSKQEVQLLRDQIQQLEQQNHREKSDLAKVKKDAKYEEEQYQIQICNLNAKLTDYQRILDKQDKKITEMQSAAKKDKEQMLRISSFLPQLISIRDQTKKSLVCRVCGDLAKTPITVIPCAHIFCKDCKSGYSNGMCSVCGPRMPLEAVYENELVQEVTELFIQLNEGIELLVK